MLLFSFAHLLLSHCDTEFRESFVPPAHENALIVRTIDYAGEEHPATAKRVVVVPVARLPLKTPEARHTFKLLAGQRWSPTPPKNAGLGTSESNDPDGYIQISCEDFPQPGMNLKWISDVLDRLIEEANVSEEFCSLVALLNLSLQG